MCGGGAAEAAVASSGGSARLDLGAPPSQPLVPRPSTRTCGGLRERGGEGEGEEEPDRKAKGHSLPRASHGMGNTTPQRPKEEGD